METSEPLPHGAVEARDLTELVRRPGPFVSLYPSDRELKELGVDSPEQGPARDVLVRAALGTGAGIRVLDDADRLEDGAGALLRWTTS
ncbi:MAG: hypothetical protein M3M93_02835 [Actinomycetota bacterium]|nr:hypothetical protein [Actinomycetota bacterium]